MKYQCPKFDVHDQALIEGARISGQPEHIARAIAVAVAGFKERLQAMMPNGLPIIEGRPHLLLSRKCKGNFFDQYVIALVLQEIADETGQIVTVIYSGEKVKTDVSVSPDIEFI